MGWNDREPHFGNIQAIQDRLLHTEFGVKASNATQHQIEQLHFCHKMQTNLQRFETKFY